MSLKKIHSLLNQKGASLVQSIVIGSVVLAAGAGVMKISQTQSKQNQSLLGQVKFVV
jgi:hypothetical protein